MISTAEYPGRRRRPYRLPFNGLGSGGGGEGGSGLSFDLPLLNTIVPAFGAGSITPTFTNASASGTYFVTDFEGLLKPVLSGEVRFTGARRVRNRVATTSEDFSNASWLTIGTLSKVGNTTVVGPSGANVTVMEVSFGANATSFLYQVVASLGAAGTAAGSVWVRTVTGSTTVRTAPSNLPTSAISVDTTWKRIGAIETGSGTTFAAVWNNAGGTSANVYVYAAQNEDVTGQSNQNPSEYVSVGVLSAPYHGASVDGVKYFTTLNGNTVASNVVTEATGAAISASTLLGYQAEGARTNYALWSRDLTNAAWVSGGGGIATAKTATGADGVANSATTLTASGANGTLLQTITRASVQRITGCYIKRRTGSGTINMTQDNGATWTVVSPTASWSAVAIPAATLANPIIGFQIVTSGDAIDVDFVMHEEAAFVSSPIPATTVSVTRNADVLLYPATGNGGDTAGSCYAEVTQPASTTGYVVMMSGSANVALFTNVGTQVRCFDGTNNNAGATYTPSITAPVKIAAAWGQTASTMQTAASGATAAATAFDGTMAFSGNLHVGSNAGTNQFVFGTIRNVRLYNRALANAQLQAMTT